MKHLSSNTKLLLAGALLALFGGSQLVRMNADPWLRWGVLIVGGVLLLFGLHKAVTEARAATEPAQGAEADPAAAAAPAEKPGPPPPPDDIKLRLAQLKDLYDSGLITAEEYGEKKAELLDTL